MWGVELEMIRVRVRLFSILRERAAREELELVLAQNSSCRDALLRLKSIFGFPESILERSLVAVNGVYAGRDTSLSNEDELALLPPVSGG